MTKVKKNNQRNVVHQHSWEINKSQVHLDKKKESKKGKRKHKGENYE